MLVGTIFITGLLLSLVRLDAGIRLAGLGLLGLGGWLWRFDIARRTIRHTGVTRFIAACLLPGYVWMMVGGVLWLSYGGQYGAGPVYDAMLHVIFVGFVFSMIFGHAPIIIPALLGVQLSFTPLFYLPLALLHLSLGLRVAGDLLFWPVMRRWGGLLNETAILLFLMLTVVVVVRGRKYETIPRGGQL